MPFQEQFAVNFSDRLNREPLDRRLYAISVGPPKHYDGGCCCGGLGWLISFAYPYKCIGFDGDHTGYVKCFDGFAI